jgi:hypothetical protein
MAIVTGMRIPDILADRGPMTAAQLAPMVGANPGVLHRMLRFLCCWRVLRSIGVGDSRTAAYLRSCGKAM